MTTVEKQIISELNKIDALDSINYRFADSEFGEQYVECSCPDKDAGPEGIATSEVYELIVNKLHEHGVQIVGWKAYGKKAVQYLFIYFKFDVDKDYCP